MRSNYPDYLLDFSCKRGGCRRTCCRHDWNVTMSEAEYRANADENLGAELHALAVAHMKPNPKSTGPGDYAYVEMVGDVRCPLLDDDGLCVWMRLAGRHACSTCVNFPCTTMSYLGQEYRMPSGGCEAVLEALLHREAPIRMVHDEINPTGRSYYVHVTDNLASRRPLLKHYPQLVEFGLAILQDRTLPLDKRMARLLEGLACIDRMENVDDLHDLPSFLARYPTQAPRGRRTGADPTAPWLPVFVCGEMFSHYCHSSAHVPTALRITEGLGIAIRETRDADGTPHCTPTLRSTGAYPARRASFEGFLARNEVFLEHVMVSLYLKALLPLREPSVWVHAQYFASLYAAVKGGLIGYFAPEEPTEGQLVDVLVEIVRMVAHSELMYPTVCKRLKETRLDSLQAMQALVRA